jgi:beta-lactam-binding protein with PASTA domain
MGAAALVVVFVVVPLLRLGQEGGGAGASPTATAAATPGDGPIVTVPDFVGMSTQQAIDVAADARLDWIVHCAQDPQQPEGIVDQEPPAGTELRRGDRMNLYSARIQDCR